MDNGTLVNRLRAFMEYIGLSNTQFADRAGIPRPTLSQILSGRNKKINNELIDKLHCAFPRLNVIWLLFGEGSMNVDNTSPAEALGASENRTDESARTLGGNEATVNVLKGNIASDFEDYAVYGLPRSAPQASLFDNEQTTAYPKSYTNDRKNKSTTPRPSTESRQTLHTDNTMSRGESTMPRVDTSVPSNDTTMSRVERLMPTTGSDGRKVVSIMVFYSDNSFEVFKPEQTE